MATTGQRRTTASTALQAMEFDHSRALQMLQIMPTDVRNHCGGRPPVMMKCYISAAGKAHQLSHTVCVLHISIQLSSPGTAAMAALLAGLSCASPTVHVLLPPALHLLLLSPATLQVNQAPGSTRHCCYGCWIISSQLHVALKPHGLLH
jgi:hypothetical protein